jgi:maltooligosyltrehalose synthase
VEQPPLGAEVWKDTWLALPPKLADHTYENLFTGEKLTAERRDGVSGLTLARIFNHFPVALLKPIGN